MSDPAEQSAERVLLLLDANRPAEAEQLARTMIASDPADAEAISLLSRCLSRQGRSAEALEAAREAVRLEPDAAWGWVRLADAAIDAGDREASEGASRRALQLAPHLWNAHYTLARALLGRRRSATQEALAAANEAVRLAPASPDAHNLAGLVLHHLGNTREARRAFERALQLDPAHAMAMNNLSALDIGGRDFGSAARHAARALATDPRGAGHVNLRASVFALAVRRTCGMLMLACVGLMVWVSVFGVQPVWPRTLAALSSLVVTLVVAVRTLRRVPEPARRWLPATIWRQRRFGFLSLGAAVVLVLLLIAMGLG